MYCTEVPEGKFPTAIWNENAAKAQDLADRMAMPGYTPTEADIEWIKGTAGNYRDAKWNYENPQTPPLQQPVPPYPLPDRGKLVVGSFVEFDGFGSWTMAASIRVTVRVFEHHGPSGVPRIITDGTQTDGGMLTLEPGTYTVSTWIFNPEPGAAYGSAIEVQPA